MIKILLLSSLYKVLIAEPEYGQYNYLLEVPGEELLVSYNSTDKHSMGTSVYLSLKLECEPMGSKQICTAINLK